MSNLSSQTNAFFANLLLKCGKKVNCNGKLNMVTCTNVLGIHKYVDGNSIYVVNDKTLIRGSTQV